MNYIEILNDPKIIDIYRKIDDANSEPFSHGMKHIKNVCTIMNDLCDTLGIPSDMKEALLIAASLHDVGQLEGADKHCEVAMNYVIDNYKDMLGNNKYYNDILQAIKMHSADSKESDSLFTILLQAADKFDFSKNRLEDNYKEKYDYFFTEEIVNVEFIYNEEYFGLNIMTTDIDNFEDLFLGLKFFHRIINIVKVIAIKLGKKPIIKQNNKVMEKVKYDI